MDARAESKSIAEFMRQQPDLRIAIVYGSVAAGRAGPQSDLDIALGSSTPGRPLTAERCHKLIEQLAELTGRPVDLVDLDAIGEPLLGEVLKGKRVFGSDEHHAALITRHLFDQADFLPLRERILEQRRRKWLGI